MTLDRIVRRMYLRASEQLRIAEIEFGTAMADEKALKRKVALLKAELDEVQRQESVNPKY